MKYGQSIIKKTILLLAAAFAVISTAGAQGVSVALPAGETTVEESIHAIESQTGYRVTFSKNKFDTSRKIRFTAVSLPLERALAQILDGSGSWYTVQGKYILIRKGEQPQIQRPIQRAPTSRAGETYVRTDIGAHDNVNRHRPAIAPVIRVVDSTVVVKDVVRSRNTDSYTSHVVPVDSYMDNRLPRFALKTNLLHGIGTLTPNLGVEFGLGRRTTLEIHGGINPWRLQSRIGDNRKLAHVFVRPEFRYWLCERFNGHFFGVHAFFAHYNVGSHDIPLLFEKEYRYDGIGIGGGLTYGYFLPFGKRWGMEFNIGLGGMWMDYDRFSCEGCERSAEPRNKSYFGPTRAGITLVFNIK